MDVAFGVWDHFERRSGVEPEQQFQQKIQLLQAAERLGFRGYHIAEHHLTPLDMAPSPNVFLAALAQATQTLRIGTMVSILPLYHPVRLVQEICMLDQLSGGRLDVGIGRGIRAVEHEWFGQTPTESRLRTEETLQILIQATTTGNLGFEGRYYQIPDAPLDMLPMQRPYPPLWYAGGIDFAGRHGLNFLGRSADDVLRYWDLVDQAADSLNPRAELLAGVTRHVVLRETFEEAEAVARRAWDVFQANFAATSLRLPDGRVAAAHEPFDAVMREGSRLLVGTPQTLRDFLEVALDRLHDRATFYFAPAFQWGDMSFEESLESLELFAREVMPRFRSRGTPVPEPSLRGSKGAP